MKKDTTETPPRYLVFFKGLDADALTAAFKEFSAKKLTQDKKPSIRKALAAFREATKQLNANRQKTKHKDIEFRFEDRHKKAVYPKCPPIGALLGQQMNFEAVTARYVDVRLERKKEVLDAYHGALFKADPAQTKEAATKKHKDMEH